MNEETLFHVALEKPPDERAAFLDEACSGDSALRERLNVLLAAHEKPGSFMQSPALGKGNGESAIGTQATALLDSVEERPGTVIGPYKLLQKIGEGGMGVVYMAQQERPVQRTVALKIIKPGMDSSQVIARFEAERQALALMDHPNIARVYDAGTTDGGRLYFVMELVKGLPITDYCDAHHLTPRQRLELFVPVCQAVQHAHQKGIIHRDLKPSNVMIALYDGRPVPKVIDFGVAKATGPKLTERTMFTEFGQVLGTMEYMSPEQAELNQLDVDTRSDIYSLGVLLYELLTGTTPLERKRVQQAAFLEALRIIREEEPPKPSTRLSTTEQLPTIAANRGIEPKKLTGAVRGELDWIVMKAMEKDRNRRYESASAFAADVGRHLANEPVNAAPPSIGYRAKKFYRRYRGPLVAAVAIAGILIAAIVAVSALAIQLNNKVKETGDALAEAQSARASEVEHRHEADRQRETAEIAARQAKYESYRNQAQYFLEQKLLDQALVQANNAYELSGRWEDSLLLSRIVNECRKNWDVDYVFPVKEKPLAAAFAKFDKAHYLIVAFRSSIIEYDLNSGELKREVSQPRVTKLIPFRGEADRIVAVGPNSVRILSLRDLSTVAETTCEQKVIDVAAGESAFAITLSDMTIHVYGNDLKLLDSTSWPPDAKLKSGQPLNKLAISPDGKLIIASGRTWTNDCLVWNRGTKAVFRKQLTTNDLSFVDNETLLGCVHHVDSSGIGVYRFTVANDVDSIQQTKIGDVPSEDMGVATDIAVSKNGLHLLGSHGLGSFLLPQAGIYSPRVIVERYTSIFGCSDIKPVPLSIAEDGSYCAVHKSDSLVVLTRSDFQGLPWYTKGLDAVLGASCHFRITSLPEALMVRITPGDSTKPPVKRFFPTIAPTNPGWHVIACGVAVSGDERTLAVRCAESDKLMNSGEEVRNHCVVVYHGFDGNTEAKAKPVVIPLMAQDDSSENAARAVTKRILQLSPNGEYLLVGTRQSRSIAELHRTSDGATIHQWTMESPLGQVVTAIPNAPYFADVSPDNRSIRLISWNSGEVNRQIKMPEEVAWFCATNDGQQIIVSLGKSQISRYEIATGRRIDTIACELLPLSWSPNNDVFIASSDDTGRSQAQSIVLADCKTGKMRAVLQKNLPLGSPANFSADGNALMCPKQDDWGELRGELIRRLTPEMAARRLSAVAHSPANATSADWRVKSELLRMPHKQSDENDELRQKLGQSVAIEGVVEVIVPTTNGRALNVLLAPADSGVLVWIDPKTMPKFDTEFKGKFADIASGRHVRVEGILGEYGGRSPAWRGRLQITLKDVKQFKILDGKAEQRSQQK